MYAFAPTTALNWCRAVTRQYSQTFYKGSLLYPPGQREAVWAVYAACRVGDDIADSGSNSSRADLDSWWGQIQAAHAGRAGEHHMQQALTWVFAHYPVPLSAFEELYTGFGMDLAGQHYETLGDLTLYCRRVAGVVGLMIAPIGGYEGGEDTLARALRLGQAMQLTNILRDVGEDLRLGRLYLPAELLRKYGVNVADLHARRMTPEYGALLRHLEGLSRQWYAEGLTGIPQLRGRARYGVAVAACLYAGILDELSANGYDNLNRRAYVSGGRKLWLGLRELRHQDPHFYSLKWAGQQYGRWRRVRA